MSKNLSAKHYSKSKERLQKNFLKKKKKSNNMAANIIKISQKIKKSLSSIEKNIMKRKKKTFYKYKKHLFQKTNFEAINLN